MEWTALLSPLISAIVAVFGAYTATKRAAEEREREQEHRLNEYQIEVSTSLAALETKLDLLSNRVEKHNNVIERTTALETDMTNVYHRLDELKKGA